MSFNYFLFDQILESVTEICEPVQICDFKVLVYVVKNLAHVMAVAKGVPLSEVGEPAQVHFRQLVR